MNRINPRVTYRWAVRVVLATGPLSVALLVAWGLRWEPLGARPQLVLMAYMLLLLLSVGAGCVAVLAACHMAIHNAFRVGIRAGMNMDPDPNPQPRRAPLRAVE